jgi:predicted peptidase
MRCLHVLSVLACLLMFITSANAQLSKKYNYTQHHFRSLRYGWFIPSKVEKNKLYPLIVYLHGSTDTVSHDFEFYHDENQKPHPAFMLTPKCEEASQGWGNTWNPGHPTATAKTLALVDSLVKVYPIDPNRLYLYGISMGGFGVFSIVAKEPGKFAAAFAVCGGSDTKAAPQLLNTPLWIFHGDADDVVPVKLSRDIYNEMIKLGGKKVRYTEYPGVKHDSWRNVFKEKDLSSWLFSQHK